MDEWKAVEKEFLDKVTMKNEHIMNASFYLQLAIPNILICCKMYTPGVNF